jgi:DNA-binding MarR family transcriptional regulator
LAAEAPAERSADELAWAVRRLDIALSEWHGELTGRMALGAPELMALDHLSMAGEMGPSELSQRLRMTTGAMTALLDRLAARGHIVREPHPDDRRRVVVRLTPHARVEALAHVRPMSDEIRHLGEHLSPDERRAVGHFIDELTAIVSRSAGELPSSREEAE